MSSIDIVKIALVGCWVLLGIGLVLYVWKKQAKAAGAATESQSKASRESAEKMEQLYNFLVQKPEGAKMEELTSFLMADESSTSEYLAQLESLGIVHQFKGEDLGTYYGLNKNSEFNLF